MSDFESIAALAKNNPTSVVDKATEIFSELNRLNTSRFSHDIHEFNVDPSWPDIRAALQKKIFREEIMEMNRLGREAQDRLSSSQTYAKTKLIAKAKEFDTVVAQTAAALKDPKATAQDVIHAMEPKSSSPITEIRIPTGTKGVEFYVKGPRKSDDGSWIWGVGITITNPFGPQVHGGVLPLDPPKPDKNNK